MNDNDLKDRPALYLLGKEFIIVIVVIFSGLSFTLGYFVGKSSRDKKSEPAAQMVEITPLPHNPEPAPAQSPGPEEIVQNHSYGTGESQEYKEDRQQRPILPKKTKAPARIKKPIKQKSHEIIYTVQLGAFKNASEAKNFKTEFDKKGYKTYITISRNNRNEKIHKIRTGEFRNKKDAVILSLNLKKTEGLNTFVTFKNKPL